MRYKTQFHFVVPSPGSVVIKTANSRVPAGVPVQASGTVEPCPSHVYATGKVPPLTPAALVSVKFPEGSSAVFTGNSSVCGTVTPPSITTTAASPVAEIDGTTTLN